MAIIISRHPAAIQFLRQSVPALADAPVVEVATPEIVRGAVVYGNLPLHLAALAAQVNVIEFTGSAPRGSEYTLADMTTAGAVVRTYTVRAV